MRNALAHATYPRWLYRGPYWWRSLNAWWLAWWGWLFVPGPDKPSPLQKAVQADFEARLYGGYQPDAVWPAPTAPPPREETTMNEPTSFTYECPCGATIAWEGGAIEARTRIEVVMAEHRGHRAPEQPDRVSPFLEDVLEKIAREQTEKVLASQMAAALADPDVHPTSKSLAANVLKRLRPDVTEKGSTALDLDA